MSPRAFANHRAFEGGTGKSFPDLGNPSTYLLIAFAALLVFGILSKWYCSVGSEVRRAKFKDTGDMFLVLSIIGSVVIILLTLPVVMVGY